MKYKRCLPVFLALLSIPFWWFSAWVYPGGTSWDVTSPGFSLMNNYVSSLFQPLALNGMDNTARPFAFLAMLLYSVGMGTMFWVLSVSYPKSVASSTVKIFGVGAMVYALIAVTTPMHDLLALISAAFLTLGMAGLIVLLYRDNRRVLTGVGVLCLLLLALLALVTKTAILVRSGPILEWLLFGVGAAWISFSYWGVTAPSQSSR
ncbi:hypothetical protein [Idiomarina sp. HP20-50]|uniref:hypothetical protein n=1 Tax=Idiomarina sp. HP20-50 TaxID=3070813 RepID=UPI00294B5B82|nr:hypothetical protein [Idiomarina sp. HP20-50]MDV6315329.1 hypothetical protein [Idiomarina sp. HP20-50]